MGQKFPGYDGPKIPKQKTPCYPQGAKNLVSNY